MWEQNMRVLALVHWKSALHVPGRQLAALLHLQLQWIALLWSNVSPM